MANPLNQFSPRTPPPTADRCARFQCQLGHLLPTAAEYTARFRNNQDALVNTDATYIQAVHYVAGLAYYVPRWNVKLALEGFTRII